jgi:Na+-transporting methylmalonyl-CoA/oxaloacetate decarboxylase gamma subunit
MEISNGIIIMVLGMGGVYTILAVIYFFMKISVFIDERLKPKKSLTLLDIDEEIEKKAAITVTLHHHNKKIRGIK